MKFSFKKISAVIAGALITGMTLGTASAATYPNPFVENGQANTAVVYGSDAMSSDQVAAGNIQTDLQDELDIGGSTPTTSSGLGDEYSLVTEDLVLDESFGDSLSDRDDELPVLLAEDTLEDESGDDNEDEVIYEQELSYEGMVKYAPLSDSEDYAVNTDESGDELPVLHIDQSGGEAYNLTVEFQDTIDATAYDDSESITIANKELTFDPQMVPEDEELVLFESKNTITVNAGESETVDGDTIEVVGADTDSDPTTATLLINGEQYQVEAGDKEAGYYVSEIFSQTVPTQTASVKLFAGSNEWVIEDFGQLADIEVEGEALDGVQVKTDGNATNLNSLEFVVTPSDMEADEKSYLEVGEELVDPLFGSFKMLFDSVEPELKADSKGTVNLDVSSGTVDLTFTNMGGNEFSISPMEINDDDDAVISHEDWYTAATYDSLEEGDIFIASEDTGKEDEMTYIYKVRNIDAGDDTDGDEEIEFEELISGNVVKVDDNEEIRDTGLQVADFEDTEASIELLDMGDNAASVNNELFTREGMSIKLVKGAEIDATSVGSAPNTLEINGVNYTANTGTALNDSLYAAGYETDVQGDIVQINGFQVNSLNTYGDADANATSGVLFGEDRNEEISLEGGARGMISAGIGIDSDDEDLKLMTYYSEEFQDHSIGGDNTDKEFALSELGTYTEADSDEWTYLDIWTPTDTQTMYNVYFSMVSGEDGGTTPETGVMLVKDTEMDSVSDKNLVVVGGSCVNTAAAQLLGVDYQTCGSDFTEAAEVGNGEALIKGYSADEQDLTSEHAVLVAGYSASDTTNAATYLMNEYPDTSKAHKVTSASKATLISSSE